MEKEKDKDELKMVVSKWNSTTTHLLSRVLLFLLLQGTVVENNNINEQSLTPPLPPTCLKPRTTSTLCKFKLDGADGA